MRKQQLVHLIIEICERFDLRELYICGASAILAVIDDPPIGILTISREINVIPPRDEDTLANQIDFVLGEGSDFDLHNGYYAQGVTSATPKYAPKDWKSRTIPVVVEKITAHCMSPVDLVLSKLGANREKDLDFAKAIAGLRLITQKELLDHLDAVEPPEMRTQIRPKVVALFPAA